MSMNTCLFCLENQLVGVVINNQDVLLNEFYILLVLLVLLFYGICNSPSIIS